MNPSLAYARTLSRLIDLMRTPTSTAPELRDTLLRLAAQAREGGVRLEFAGTRLLLDGEPPSDTSGLATLVECLRAHGVRRFEPRQYASATEVVKVARLLAGPPSADPSAFARQAAAQQLWHVALVGAASADGGAPVTLPPAQQAVVAHLLARVRASTLAVDAEHALDALGDLAERYAAEGAAEAVAAVLVGVVRAEVESGSRSVRAACSDALGRLAKPAITRLVAQRLPALAGHDDAFRTHLDAIGRCGDAGAAALLAHIMAAETMAERRVFYDAIVALRAGIPLLVHALERPQWFVVRNAACMLGEMAATEADEALARLLDHADERVREAAAGALARLDTTVARDALQRMLHDRSPSVRAHAASAFATAGQPRVATPLVAALDAEADPDVQLSILAALGRLATPDAVQRLVRAAAPEPPPAPAKPTVYRIAALEALAAARGTSALPTLRTLAGDVDPVVRAAVERLILDVALAA